MQPKGIFRKSLNLGFIFFAFHILETAPGAWAIGVSGDGTISGALDGSPIVVKTSTRFAGAIYSLTWKGVQFINDSDHGRELQSASSFEGFGECYNPTEAGSARDGVGAASSSLLLQFQASGNQLSSLSQMAFWEYPGSTYTASKACGSDASLHTVQNTTVLSQDSLAKQVTIGFHGIPNVIEDLVTFHEVLSHTNSSFQSLVAVMPSAFSKHYAFNPSNGALVLSPNGVTEGVGNTPSVIYANGSGSAAMGIYSPDVGNPAEIGGFDSSYFVEHTMDGINSWYPLINFATTSPGDYRFRHYLAVGSLAEVQQALTQVYGVFHVPVASPNVVGYVDVVASTPSGGYNLQGWVCSPGSSAPVYVDVYLGGTEYSGTYAGRYLANQPSEPAVSNACGLGNVPGNFRISIPISAETVAKFVNQGLSIYGLSNAPVTRTLVSAPGLLVQPLPGANLPLIAFGAATANNVLASSPASQAINNNPNLCYSSKALASTIDPAQNLFLAAWFAKGPVSVTEIDVQNKLSNGVPIAYATSYHVYFTAPDNSGWTYDAGVYVVEPEGPSGISRIHLNSTTPPTYGVMLLPESFLFPDSNHSFQVCGLIAF